MTGQTDDRLLTDEEIAVIVDDTPHQAIKVSLALLIRVAKAQDAKTAEHLTK